VVDVADELLQEGLGGTELAQASGPVERLLQRRPRATEDEGSTDQSSDVG
jgi:hypothetical protein